MDKGLGNPAGEVCSGTIDLAVILSGKGTTTVSTPSTVGVYDDLTASQTSVTLWATDDEKARGLDLPLLVAVHSDMSANIRGRRSSRRGSVQEWSS